MWVGVRVLVKMEDRAAAMASRSTVLGSETVVGRRERRSGVIVWGLGGFESLVSGVGVGVFAMVEAGLVAVVRPDQGVL